VYYTKGVKSFVLTVKSKSRRNKQANPNGELEGWFPISEGEKVTIFFLRGGKQIFYSSSPDFEQVDSHHPILELAGSVNWNYADRNLYVVELNPKVFNWEQRFFEAGVGTVKCILALRGRTAHEDH
jgi:hypothetical protein